MYSVCDACRRPGFIRLATTVALAALVAGCSSEFSRFGLSDPDYTGSIQPTPVETVGSEGKVDPKGMPEYDNLTTGSVTNVPANNYGDGTSVVVAEGDTLYSIARRFGIPPEELAHANGIADGKSIRPGQRLTIPVYSRTQTAWVNPDQAVSDPAPRVTNDGPVQLNSAPQQPVAVPAAKPVATSHHTVAHGETVYSIGRAYKMNPNAIIAANNLGSPDTIKVGQRLVIPSGSAAAVQQPASKPQVTVAAPTAKPAEQPKETKTAAVAPAKPVTSDALPTPVAMTSSTFRWPVRGRVISSFGDKSDGEANDGINISVPEGASIRAAENGVVAYAGNELQGWGNLILVKHADNWVSTYAHNSTLLVKRGDKVTRGQIIARAGKTGNVSAPQLHFELRHQSKPVDPLRHLSGT